MCTCTYMQRHTVRHARTHTHGHTRTCRDTRSDTHAHTHTRSYTHMHAHMCMRTQVDKLWHVGLIFKLEQNGISGNLLRLLQNYLSNRKQRVVLNGSYSDYSSVESRCAPRLWSWSSIISCFHQ